MGMVLGSAALVFAIVEGVSYTECNATSLTSWILLLGLLASSIINYIPHRDILYPAFIFSAVWLLAAAVYTLYPYEIDPLSWSTISIFLAGNLCFSLGCAFGNRPFRKQPAWFTARAKNAQPRRLLVLYSVLMVPIVAYSAMKLAGVYNLSPAFFIAARDAIVASQTEGKPVYSNIFVAIAPTIAVSTAFILLMEESERWLVAVGIGAAVVLGLLTTGRVIWLLLFCGWMMLYLLKKSDRSVLAMANKITSITIVITLVLTLVTLLTKNETQVSHLGDKSGIEIAAGLTASYIAGPLAGFNYVVRHPEAFAKAPNNTFAQILAPLSAVGFRYEPPPEYDPFFPVPFPINVFTAYKNYYVDFGLMGCLIAFTFFGFISGYLFHSSLRGNQIATFFFAYLFFAMLFTPFQDVYHSFNRYVYAATFGVIYFGASRWMPKSGLIIVGRKRRS
jgi:oligosaccharide repeat unit polymerase